MCSCKTSRRVPPHLGFSYDALAAANPRLIVCDISGYGADGPYRDKKAYDLLIQSESGFLSITGSPDAPAKAGCSIADIAAGMYAYTNILAALIERGRTGRGCAIDVSMLESMVEWMGYPLYYAYDGAEPPPRAGAAHATIYPYGPFVAGDGKIRDARIAERARVGGVLRQGPGTARARHRRAVLVNSRRTAARDELRAIIIDVFRPLTAAEVIRARRRADRECADERHEGCVGASAARRAQAVGRRRHAGGPGAGSAAARRATVVVAADGRGARAGPAHGCHPARARVC
jgi:crotonobetainyl-CoA:carnitine CoA-transferase CaiB-like acyl-CoA transferase